MFASSLASAHLTLNCPSFLLQKWGGDPESKDNRLSGSQTLFLHIKQTVKNVSRLSKDTLFFQTFEEISRGLLAYANLLESKIPKKPDTSHLTPRTCIILPFESRAHSPILLSVGRAEEIQAVCLIVNTAEYCNETMPHLEESLKKVTSLNLLVSIGSG